MGRSNFEELEVYQLSETVADRVWELVHEWPQFAKSSLGNQLVRSADSIGANRYHVRIARGSLYETKHWLRRAYRRDLLTDEQVAELKPLLDELAPRLNAYLNSIG